MGTRHLVAVMIDGEYKVAQYGQYDGYPDGVGVALLAFLQARENLEGLRAGARLTSWGTGTAAGDHLDGVHVVAAVARQEPRVLRNSISFAADSLFCEWAYVIDFDKNTFEVYRGFNTTRLAKSERFYYQQPKKPRLTKKQLAEQVTEGLSGKRVYFPVRHMHSFKLDDLPSKGIFLSSLGGSRTDDDE